MDGDTPAPSPAATQGDSAASPTAPPLTPEQERAFFGDPDSDDGDQTSSPDVDAGDRDPASKKADEPATDADKAEGEKEAGELPAKTARRMQKLLEERRKSTEALAKLEEEHETAKLTFKTAASKLMAEVQSLKERLAKYEDVDTAEAELARLKGRQQTAAELEKARGELQQRLARQREERARQEYDAEASDFLDDTITEALKGFETITRDQLVAAFAAHAKENPEVLQRPTTEATEVFRSLAQKLDEAAFARYEARILDKHKARLTAPVPISSTGSATVHRPRTTEEIARDLDRVFGKGAFD